MAMKRVDHRSILGTSSKRFFLLFSAAIALAMVYAPASDAQIVLGQSINLTNLTGNETIIVGDKAFTDFTFSSSTGFQPGQINVTPITENGDFGIRFSGLILGGMAGTDIILGYQVSVTNSANMISSANMLFNGFVPFGMGEASVFEQVFTNTPPAYYGSFSVFATATTNQLSNSLPIVPPQSLLTISKDVSVEAFVPAFAEISTIDQTFTQVPEPSVLVLVAAGFFGLTLLRRRRH
jgi:PEP-CTERM motif-containing protein